MFLRLQAPNLAQAMPAPQQTRRKTVAGASTTTLTPVATNTRRGRRMSETSTSTGSSTIRLPALDSSCRTLTIFMDSDMVSPSDDVNASSNNSGATSSGYAKMRSISVADALYTNNTENLHNIESIVIHEVEQLKDLNSQSPMTKFLRNLQSRLDPKRTIQVTVHRQLGKSPPAQTATNAFIRKLTNATIHVHISAYDKKQLPQFPPGDLELFQHIVSIDMNGTFVRFERDLPAKLERVSLINNYTTFSDKQARDMFSVLPSLTMMELDMDFLRSGWLPPCVTTLKLRRADRQLQAFTSSSPTQETYEQVRTLVVEIARETDCAALASYRFPQVQELKIILKNSQMGTIYQYIDECLDAAYPETIVLDLPEGVPYHNVISPSIASGVTLLKVIPNSEPFRPGLLAIHELFVNANVLDFTNRS